MYVNKFYHIKYPFMFAKIICCCCDSLILLLSLPSSSPASSFNPNPFSSHFTLLTLLYLGVGKQTQIHGLASGLYGLRTNFFYESMVM